MANFREKTFAVTEENGYSQENFCGSGLVLPIGTAIDSWENIRSRVNNHTCFPPQKFYHIQHIYKNNMSIGKQ